jgi:DNA topoisomerase IA
MERLWISSMEDAAIREGFDHLRPGSDYDKLYDAAVCRAGADWLIGINATRLFSVLYMQFSRCRIYLRRGGALTRIKAAPTRSRASDRTDFSEHN